MKKIFILLLLLVPILSLSLYDKEIKSYNDLDVVLSQGDSSMIMGMSDTLAVAATLRLDGFANDTAVEDTDELIMWSAGDSGVRNVLYSEIKSNTDTLTNKTINDDNNTITNIDGENITNDTIDDDSIDFADVTCVDITMTDCGAIIATAEITADELGIEFQETDAITDCSSFATTGGGIFYDDSEGVLKKCQDNVLSVLSAGGGTGAFSDSADPVVLNTTTKDVVVGAAQKNTSKFTVDNEADQVGITVQGHSTQTTSLAVFEQSDGTDALTISNTGDVVIAGTISVGAGGGGSDLTFSGGGVIDGATSNTIQFTGTIDMNDQVITGIAKDKSFALLSPVDADAPILFKAPRQLTVTDIDCIVDPAGTGESVIIDIRECNSTGDSCASVDATITCDNDGATDDGSFTNAVIDSGDWVQADIGTVTGTVSVLTTTIQYTE